MITTLIADNLFDGNNFHSNLPVTFEDGHIISFDTVVGAQEFRLNGLLTAGFIDLQVNGGGGLLLNHNTDINTLNKMVKAHTEFGTTGCLPTLITSDKKCLEKAANTISHAIATRTPGVLGVHFEGPHISKQKKGIHKEECIRPLNQQELDLFCRDDLGLKVVTLAPEVVSTETIKTLVANNVHVCLGHSNASYEQTISALEAGASGFTHLFNAMSALGSRAPNMVGAALLDRQSWCGLILDGHHVHPATAKLAYQAKAPEKMILVTDAMSTIGSDQSQLHFDGHDIELIGDKLISQTGQLAGSALDMVTAVNNAMTMLGCSLAQALKMASIYPANFLDISPIWGQLTIGSRADLTLLSIEQSAPLKVLNSWIAGMKSF